MGKASLTNLPLLFLILFISLKNGYGQKLIPDTLYVEFAGDTLIQLPGAGIASVTDTRLENSHFLSYAIQKKYLLIPVDKEIYTERPLAEEIKNWLPDTAGKRTKYDLIISEFSIDPLKVKNPRNNTLTADIRIIERAGDSTRHVGTFYYNYKYQARSKKMELPIYTKDLLSDWSEQFKLDLLELNAVNELGSENLVSNLIIDPKVSPQYLNMSASAFGGFNWYGMQGEIFFARPETSLKKEYTSALIRYQWNPDYQSIALGRKALHWMWRRSEWITFDVDFNFLIGFCKWHDVELHKPTLYQIFDFEFSSVQKVCFNPINKKGIILQAGLIENFTYLIPDKTRFQMGLFLGIGAKI